MSRSLLLTLDTKYAKDGTTTSTTSNPVETQPHEAEEHNSIEDDHVTSSSLLGVKITLINSQRLVAVLGVLMTSVIFFAAAVLLYKRRKRQQRQHIVDKQCLLTHEILNADQIRVSFSN